MKKYIKVSAALLMLLLLHSCGNKNPYDNSTPEKFIISLGQIGLQPKEQNPIPFFYLENDALSITKYDDAALKSLAAFQSFKTALNQKYPAKIKTIDDKEIILNIEPNSLSTLSFRLSASVIRNQLQENAPGDFVFVSAAEESADGITKVTYEMKGRENNVDLKLTNGQYLMFLPEGSLKQLNKMIPFFVKSEAILSGFLQEIENNDLTLNNFDEKVKDWNFKYQEILSLLK